MKKIINEEQRSKRTAGRRKKSLRIAGIGVSLILVGVPVLLVGHAVLQARRDEALVRAVQRNDTQGVLKLLDEGAHANALDETDRKGTPFQRLIEDLEAKRHNQYAPPNPVLYMMLMLHYDYHARKPMPRYPENPVIVKALLDHGADSNTRDAAHTSVLMMAAFDGYDAIVRLLLAAGADYKLKNKEGDTALQIAIKWQKWRQPASLALLRQAGAKE